MQHAAAFLIDRSTSCCFWKIPECLELLAIGVQLSPAGDARVEVWKAWGTLFGPVLVDWVTALGGAFPQSCDAQGNIGVKRPVSRLTKEAKKRPDRRFIDFSGGTWHLGLML